MYGMILPLMGFLLFAGSIIGVIFALNARPKGRG